MRDTASELGVYLHLARASERQRRPLVRDKMLVLAGAVASEQGLDQIAAFCRRQVLAHNPAHWVRRFPSFSAALADDGFRDFHARLTRHYSREKAEYLLDSFGIELARERSTYFSEHEYAAALLGTSAEALEELFGGSREADDSIDVSTGVDCDTSNNSGTANEFESANEIESANDSESANQPAEHVASTADPFDSATATTLPLSRYDWRTVARWSVVGLVVFVGALLLVGWIVRAR